MLDCLALARSTIFIISKQRPKKATMSVAASILSLPIGLNMKVSKYLFCFDVNALRFVEMAVLKTSNLLYKINGWRPKDFLSAPHILNTIRI